MGRSVGGTDAFPAGAANELPEHSVLVSPYGSAPGNCAFSDMLPGGSIPGGAGKWGHQDLAGNMSEWVLDFSNPSWYATYAAPGSCDDCANLTDGTQRVAWSGGTFGSNTTQAFINSYARGTFRDAGIPADSRSFAQGVRCARTP